MNETAFPLTIDQFYRFIGQKKLMAIRCSNCGGFSLPPKPMCTNCLSTDFNWLELKPEGNLLTYTIIHVAPERFQSMVPYAFGIIELEYGLKLPGMVRDVDLEDLEIGMRLKVDFDTEVFADWPRWPRYYFKQP